MSTSHLTPCHSSSEVTGECYFPGGYAWRERVHVARYSFASPFVAGKTILDIACGSGYGSYQLAQAGARSVLGVDISADNVSFAKNSYRHRALSFHQGDIVSWGEAKEYDVIVCFETIEHISSYQKALANCRRLIKDGGTLLISSPNRSLSSPRLSFVTDTPENRFHFREFKPSELSLLLEAHGFSTGRSSVFGQVFQPIFSNFILTKAYRKWISRPFGQIEVRQCSKHRYEPNYFLIVGTAAETASLSNR